MNHKESVYQAVLKLRRRKSRALNIIMAIYLILIIIAAVLNEPLADFFNTNIQVISIALILLFGYIGNLAFNYIIDQLTIRENQWLINAVVSKAFALQPLFEELLLQHVFYSNEALLDSLEFSTDEQLSETRYEEASAILNELDSPKPSRFQSSVAPI